MDRWSSTFDDDELRAGARPPRGGAWVLLFGCGVLLFVSALFWVSQGRFFDSAFYVSVSDTSWKTVDESMPAAGRLTSAVVRLYGALGICAGIFVMATAAVCYRRGERWAWYVFWTIPLCAALDFATLAAYHALTMRNALWDVALLLLALIGLIAPYQEFFPLPRPAPRRP